MSLFGITDPVSVREKEINRREEPFSLRGYSASFFRKTYVFSLECFAVIRYVIPAAIQWWMDRVYYKKMDVYPIRIDGEEKSLYAYLYYYKQLDIAPGEKVCPILFMHGSNSHPFTMSHLADIALKAKKGPVFFLHLPSCDDDTLDMAHASLLGRIMDKMCTVVEVSGGICGPIKIAGHSKGGILSAGRLFGAKLTSRIGSVFAIASRLYSPEEDNSCAEPLKSFVNKIYRRIQKHSDRILIQIVPKDDWNAPSVGMKVRPGRGCYEVEGSHLSGLYSNLTRKWFSLYLEGPAALAVLKEVY